MSLPDHIPGLPFYDKSGAQITLTQHMELSQDQEYKRVALWRDGDTVVSTVWLGIDVARWADKPHVFETMVFQAGNAGPAWRYPTEAAAIAGHDQVVAWVRDGMAGDMPTPGGDA